MPNSNYHTLDSIWENVIVTKGCWRWTGYLLPNGYGLIGRRQIKGSRLAHRWFYELLIGPIPEGLQLDHLCRNRSCVNPAHLEPVTHKVNGLRGVGPPALNARKTHCIHGHLFDAENTHLAPDGTRRCRACAHERAVCRWETARLGAAVLPLRRGMAR